MAIIYSNLLDAVLVRVSIAENRHHDQGYSYKGQHLIRAHFLVLRFSPSSLWWEAWQHPGKLEKLPSRQLAGRSLKGHPQNDTLPPTRPYFLLIVPFLEPTIFKPPQMFI